MTTWVFFNTVHADGTGDFSHFYDIITALRHNSDYDHITFIAIVCFANPEKRPRAYRRIAEKIDTELKPLGITCYFGSHDDHQNTISQDGTLQTQLQEAEQAIIISFDSFFAMYESHLPADIPVKSIAEHEMGGVYCSKTHNHTINVSLGLSTRCYGIKVPSSNHPPITPLDAWHSVNEHCPLFSSSLMTQTHAADFSDFREHNRFVPAYFNNEMAFSQFVYGLVNNTRFLNGKDLVIYQSGFDFTAFLNSTDMKQLTAGAYFKQIDIISPDNEPITLEGDPNNTTTIRIFTGFNLDDPSYQALFLLGDGIAGVSGDNSFEQCVSQEILPVYWSTNMTNKMPTIQALTGIIQSSDLVIAAKQEYARFFHPDACYRYKLKGDLNLPLLIENWPYIAGIIRNKYNFYDKLDELVLRDLPNASPSTTYR